MLQSWGTSSLQSGANPIALMGEAHCESSREKASIPCSRFIFGCQASNVRALVMFGHCRLGSSEGISRKPIALGGPGQTDWAPQPCEVRNEEVEPLRGLAYPQKQEFFHCQASQGAFVQSHAPWAEELRIDLLADNPGFLTYLEDRFLQRVQTAMPPATSSSVHRTMLRMKRKDGNWFMSAESGNKHRQTQQAA